jgi:hypothetical protein
MKRTLVGLAGTFDTLGAQTAQVAALKPDIDTTHQVGHFYSRPILSYRRL